MQCSRRDVDHGLLARCISELCPQRGLSSVRRNTKYKAAIRLHVLTQRPPPLIRVGPAKNHGGGRNRDRANFVQNHHPKHGSSVAIGLLAGKPRHPVSEPEKRNGRAGQPSCPWSPGSIHHRPTDPVHDRTFVRIYRRQPGATSSRSGRGRTVRRRIASCRRGVPWSSGTLRRRRLRWVAGPC